MFDDGKPYIEVGNTGSSGRKYRSKISISKRIPSSTGSCSLDIERQSLLILSPVSETRQISTNEASYSKHRSGAVQHSSHLCTGRRSRPHHEVSVKNCHWRVAAMGRRAASIQPQGKGDDGRRTLTAYRLLFLLRGRTGGGNMPRTADCAIRVVQADTDGLDGEAQVTLKHGMMVAPMQPT